MAFKTFVNGVNLPASDVNDYLMKQSVMTFASSGARASALTVPVEGMFTYLADVDRYEFWNGTSWQLVDSGIFADSAARTSGVTSPVEGIQSFLKATSATDTANQIDFYNGSAWESIYTPGRNAVINGSFDIWQRGTSFSLGAANAYTADRWQAMRVGAVAGMTVSRQSSGLTGFQYCGRFQRDSGNTNTAALQVWHTLETASSIPLAGQTVTLSFYARAGANYSASSNILIANFYSGTGTDQNLNIGGFTGSTTVGSLSASLTASWQRFSITVSVSSAATQLGILFQGNVAGTAGAADYFEIAGVQLEAGSVATPFRRAGGTIAGERQVCLAYYQRITSDSTANTITFGTAGAGSSTAAFAIIPLPVPLRTLPSTTLDWTGTPSNYTVALPGVNAWPLNGTPTIAATQSSNSLVHLTLSLASGPTAGGSYTLRSNIAANIYLGFSAEL